MSSVTPPEFFLDRSLGKETAHRLRERGFVVHLIADFYGDDAQRVADQTWVDEGGRRGWVLLTKDKKIRYRRVELEPLDGFLFCLVGGGARIDAMATRFLAAMPAIVRAVERDDRGFWHIHADGSIRRMWP